ERERSLAVGCARRLRPRNARVSTVSERCAVPPHASRAWATNSQPVHASTATCTSRPANRAIHARTAAGSDAIRPRDTSPVTESRQSNVIWRTCTSNPAMIAATNADDLTPAAFRATDPLPSLTVGTSYSQWPAARLVPARAYNAVRHGGPTTFHRRPNRPTSTAVHTISVARGGHNRAASPSGVGRLDGYRT